MRFKIQEDGVLWMVVRRNPNDVVFVATADLQTAMLEASYIFGTTKQALKKKGGGRFA